MTVIVNNTSIELEGTAINFVVEEEEELNQLLVVIAMVVIYSLRGRVLLSTGEEERFEYGYALLHLKLMVLECMLLLNTFDQLVHLKSDDTCYIIGLLFGLCVHLTYFGFHLAHLILFKGKIELIAIALLPEIFLFGDAIYLCLSCLAVLCVQVHGQ